MNRNLLVQYLNTRRISMSKQEDAVQLHSAFCEAAPDFYLHLLADPVAEISHKRTVLANLVCMPAARHIDRQRILELLRTLPASEVLSIIEELYLDRVNRRRAVLATSDIRSKKCATDDAITSFFAPMIHQAESDTAAHCAVYRSVLQLNGNLVLSKRVGVAPSLIEGQTA